MQRVKKLLLSLDKLTDKGAAWTFGVIGFLTFIVCLNNPFMGDDITQIVDNLPVHFMNNIGFFFTSSTFYNGQVLVGTYYRPLMTTTFSFLYTFFETWTPAYHIFQIGLFTAGSFVLYLVLKRFVRQRYALLLALFFMVNPMNSQIVFSIACMQDALMFFFGITSLYILITRNSWRSLIVVAIGLLLTLFSKESGLGYVITAFGYLLFFDRKRLWKLAVVCVAPFALYLYLKIIAVGLFIANAHGSPIGEMALGARLLTAPSIIEFYLGKFIFPLFLSTCWYWTNPIFSFFGVLVPGVIDLAVVAFFAWLGILVARRKKKSDTKAYIFFAIWSVLGIIPYTQVTPLDMTACETWFAFSMIGILAMIGLALPSVKLKRFKLKAEWVFIAVIILIAVFAIRTIVRGTDYRSQYSIASHDIAVSQDDYSAMNNIAQYMLQNNKYAQAKKYAQDSIAIFPGLGNYDNLGVVYQKTGHYDQAINSYNKALSLGSMDFVYENLAQIYLADWQKPQTEQFLAHALTLYPSDYKLETYMAILQGANGDNAAAKTYIQKAALYGPVPAALTQAIMTHARLTFLLPVKNTLITLR
jgi:Tfp pilus assembly protein PilF